MKTPLYRESGTGPIGGWQPPTLEELQAILPAYDFLGLIGCGGMGAVYHARQRSLRRSVAVKILPQALMNQQEARFTERFRREALTMARLNHPGIVSAIESGEAGGFLYLVMEHVDGPDVARLLRDAGRLAPEVAVSIASQIAEALDYAHASGVIHRDIKPGNILLTREGRVKITDFGLACRSDETQPDLTRSNIAVGTADYLAPEALGQGLRVDGRADIYSLGVTFFQMLSGSVPRGRWKMPSQTVGADPRLDEILRRTLAADPEHRYPSSAALLKELAPIRAGLARTPAEKRALRLRILRRAAPFAAAAVVLALGAVLWTWMQPREVTVPHFAKRDDFLEVPGFGANSPTNELTIEFWARPTSYRGQAVFEMVPDDPDSQCRFLLNGHGGLSSWEFGSAPTDGHLIGTAPADAPGLWTHYALVVSQSANRMQMFTNGVLHAEKQGMSTRPRREAVLRIGGSTLSFRGQLADFRVWDHARSAQQIRSGLRSQPDPDAPGLVLHFPLTSPTPVIVTNLASATGALLDGTFPRTPAWTNLPAPGQSQSQPAVTPPQTWIVRSLEDSGDNTLRSALGSARNHDRIRFDAALSGGTLRLTKGPLQVRTSVDIDALDLPLGFTLDGDRKSRVLEVVPTAIVRIAGLTFTNGSAQAGAGIQNDGWLRLEQCVIAGNHSVLNGAGIYSHLDTGLLLTRCRVVGNQSDRYGGGLWIGGFPGVGLTNTTFTANQAHLGGGAMVAYFAPVLMSDCTITNNSALTEGNGGIMLDVASIHIADSIIAGNPGPVEDPIWLKSGARKVDLSGRSRSTAPSKPNP